MTTAALAKTGVEAVIDGLGEFEDGFGIMNKLVGGFGKTARGASGDVGLLEGVFNAVGDSLRRITDFVVAGIILRGIEAITGAIKNMIASVIEAAIEFQGLQIRLEGLIAQEIFEGGQVDTFTEALGAAVPVAEDLFFWIQKLALQTPFDIRDVADVVTLAEAYGFQTEKAKELTTTIIDFASGMGLSDIQMKRVIENFGQMIQQGKVAGTELRDLARGAFVPVNDVLKRMQENLGLTTKELEKMRKEGLTETEAFIEAFIEIVGERFPDAGKRASRTIKAVVGNIKDLVQGVLSFNVVKPVLDVVADKFAGVLDALTEGDRGDKLIQLTSEIGDIFAGLAETVFGGLDAESIADTVLGVLDTIKGKIVGIAEILKQDTGAGEKAAGILILLGFSEETINIISTWFEKVRAFITEKIPEIKARLAEVGTFIREDFMPAFEKISTWVIDNGPTILKFIVGFKVAWAVLIGVFKVVAIVIGIVLAVMGLLNTPILILIGLIPILVGLFVAFWEQINIAGKAMIQFGVILISGFFQAVSIIKNIATDLFAGFAGGFVVGIVNAWNVISPWLTWFVDNVKSLLGINSPSKLFAEFGKNINEGLAQGIVESIQLPAQAMDMAVQHVVSAGSSAMQGNNTTNNTTTNNFNMAINSSARTEPIVADFNAMKAMAGA